MKKRRSYILVALLLVIALGMFAMNGCGKRAAEEPSSQPEAAKPESEPEPAPEPLPEPEPVYTAWLPLTGEGVDENDPRLKLRPLSVKIENTPESRPSMGLTYADVVYETITEGGITRFNAIFHSTIPNELGSVRSGRNSDTTIVPQYGALFVFSGCNSVVLEQLAASIPNRISEGNAGNSFYRVQQKSAPHNLYFNPKLGYERFEELGADIYTDEPRGLSFGKNDMEGLGGSKATEIFVPFSAPVFDVTWKYDPESGAYFRYIKGEAQVDESDNARQVRAENVVVLGPPYSSNGDGLTLAINFNGEGNAILFQDGMRLDLTYYSDGTHPPTLRDSNGKTVFFKPGQTWFQAPGNVNVAEVIN